VLRNRVADVVGWSLGMRTNSANNSNQIETTEKVQIIFRRNLSHSNELNPISAPRNSEAVFIELHQST
jgi:hypothetical protein